jgi:hypothetical protein
MGSDWTKSQTSVNDFKGTVEQDFNQIFSLVELGL